ncbi:MAG: MliC family protein [Rhodobacteraceae bacterium]|nr:MliC family protein [Paracoccaceae bacterium]
MHPAQTMFATLAASAALASPAGAQDLTLPFPAPEAEMTEASYRCGDGPVFGVRYVNADPNFLAVLAVEGETRVFVSVLAASGVRYVSGPYQWWTKGGGATLSDIRKDGPGQDCQSVS